MRFFSSGFSICWVRVDGRVRARVSAAVGVRARARARVRDRVRVGVKVKVRVRGRCTGGVRVANQGPCAPGSAACP